jgi:hypothetical protein
MLPRMPIDDLLGRIARLTVRRLGPPGAFLAVDPEDASPRAATVLLPGTEAPKDLAPGDEVEVFVHLDSEARPIATLKSPAIVLGEVAFLEVVDVGRFGAFVDWGLPKQLLVPFAEQTRDVRRGDRHPIALYVDDTGRLAGTMRVSEHLGAVGEFELDEWVEGEAWRKEPGIGIFVIVEKRFVALLPEHEHTTLGRGDAARFRVASVLPDGKVELSLRGHAHQEIDADAKRVLAVIGKPGAPRVGDGSSPDEIREVFGLSKKAFKRAAGRLLKEGAARIDEDGALVATRVAAPGSGSRRA